MPDKTKRKFAIPYADAETLQAFAWKAVEKAKRKRAKSKDAKKDNTKSAKKKS